MPADVVVPLIALPLLALMLVLVVAVVGRGAVGGRPGDTGPVRALAHGLRVVPGLATRRHVEEDSDRKYAVFDRQAHWSVPAGVRTRTLTRLYTLDRC